MSLNERLPQERVVAVMDGIVGVVRRGDQELGIEYVIVAVNDVVGRHRVHVMDDDLVIDLIAFDAEVHTEISGDHIVTSLLPLSRSVESLVQITIEPESGLPDFTAEPEVGIPLFKGVKPSEFGICPSLQSTHPRDLDRHTTS